MRSLTLLSRDIFLPVHGLTPSSGFGGGAFFPSPPSPPGLLRSLILSWMVIGFPEAAAGLTPELSGVSVLPAPTGLSPALPRNWPGTGAPLPPADLFPFISEGLGNLFSVGGVGLDEP